MPEYLRPGVFIEEIERGPRPFEGVPTSTAAFLGEAERGPISPRLVTGYTEYKRWFGDVFGSRDRFLPYAVNGFFENGGKRLFVCRVVGEGAAKARASFGDFDVTAIGAGDWGNRVFVTIKASTTKTKDGDGNPVPVGFRLVAAYWSDPLDEPFDPTDVENRTKAPRPQIFEDFDDLEINPRSADFWEKRLTDNSSLIVLTNLSNDETAEPEPGEGLLEDGRDDPTEVGVNDFQGVPVGGQRDDPQGLFALELDPYREVALVYAPSPPAQPDEIAKAVVTHCEQMRFRFAVIDAPLNAADTNSLDPRTDLVETEYAAIYHPWLRVSDPQNGALKYVPPGGYALGVYARTDSERGVWKAPANETVRGAVSLKFDINDAQQEVLNPRGVNAIRSFPGRGIRVWGGRTLSANSLWKYVSVRRLFIFLERTIYENTQWVVFEPNDDRLWARVKDSVRLFLRSQRRQLFRRRLPKCQSLLSRSPRWCHLRRRSQL